MNKQLIDAAGYTMTIPQISDFVTSNQVSCMCGYIFRRGDIRNYWHDDGFAISGYQRKQWIYFHCRACQCNTNLKKVLRKIALAKELEKQ